MGDKGTSQVAADVKKIRGIYVLLISVKRDILIGVGALGKIKFAQGTYAYVGSAQNGIKKRVTRHLKKGKRKFWHIDHLLEQEDNSVEEIFYQKAPKKKECRMAEALSKLGEPIKGFGCSDCSCISHLFRIEELPRGVSWDRDMGRLEKLQVTVGTPG